MVLQFYLQHFKEIWCYSIIFSCIIFFQFVIDLIYSLIIIIQKTFCNFLQCIVIFFSEHNL